MSPWKTNLETPQGSCLPRRSPLLCSRDHTCSQLASSLLLYQSELQQTNKKKQSKTLFTSTLIKVIIIIIRGWQLSSIDLTFLLWRVNADLPVQLWPTATTADMLMWVCKRYLFPRNILLEVNLMFIALSFLSMCCFVYFFLFLVVLLKAQGNMYWKVWFRN